MQRKTVIIYKSEVPECFGNLRLFCETKGIKYNTYNRKQMPFEYDGFEVHRVPFLSGKFEDEDIHCPMCNGINVLTKTKHNKNECSCGYEWD